MLELYRTDEYFEGGDVGYASYTALEPALRATFRRLVRQLRRRGFGGDLLDLGCGYGFLLEEARSTFRSATGTEFSERAAAVARARGLKVVTGGLHDLPAGSRFDCIVASHVVEHLYDPVAVLPTILARLRPGGSLVVATPDMGSAWRRLLGARWPSFKVPEHVLYLDRDALGRLLAGAGFVAVRPMPFRHAFPLGLVVERAGLAPIARRLGRIARVPVWLPGTTVAAVGRRPAATDSAPAGPEPGARLTTAASESARPRPNRRPAHDDC